MSEAKEIPQDKASKDRELKAKNLGAVCVIELGENGEKKLYLKTPDRNVIGLYYGKKKDSVNIYDASDFLLRNTAIKEVSDFDEIFANEAMMYGAYMQHDILFDFIEVKKNTSRKL